MKFETIKRVILAAIMLPFVFMLIEGVVVIRSSVTQYRNLEKDRQFADVLARGGSIAATEILSEIGATRRYLARPNSRTAADMLQSRVTLDRERRAFYASLPSRDALDEGLVGELSILSLAYSRIIAARSAVDQGRYTGSDPGSIYWYAALKQLAVVDALSPLISDPVLLEKSNQLMGILLTYYGERLITGVGTRYLDHGVSARLPVELFVQGKVMLGEGMDHMVFHSSAPIVRDIVAYLGRSNQVKANAITDAILAGSRPTGAVHDVWAAAQSERMTFLQQKMIEAAKDIHETGENLSMRSHIHLTRILALCAGLLILATLVMVLAAKGLRLIDRLTQDREALVGELRSAAQTDLLTGLYNRRGFEVAASALLTQAEHGSRWISVVLFDLDHFKKINDINGHDAGDAVLRQVAGVARENFRSFDLLVRHGGEEFLALLPDSTPDDAAIVAERVRLAIEAASGRNCVVSGPTLPAPAQEERRKAASGGGFDFRK
ncbi:GGDEF domain-containing protein [Rhizobium leguminosarum]|uniref:GGDEF domain-containing protein n=1 Tax=Rhizobium leguminosarum TaxID=384 RepID=UPI0012F98039|nr:GGDEF domain-containing protein [Rhizobium leguminosarum]MVO96412.1 diguanylate cyclase [Rhizobium leguminosarum bv. phaseoli]